MTFPIASIQDLAADRQSALATGPFGSSIGSKTFQDEGVPVIRGSNLSAEVGIRLLALNYTSETRMLSHTLNSLNWTKRL
jgi:hypothetical protein